MPQLDLRCTDIEDASPDRCIEIGSRLIAYLTWPQNEQRREEYLTGLESKGFTVAANLPVSETFIDVLGLPEKELEKYHNETVKEFVESQDTESIIQRFKVLSEGQSFESLQAEVDAKAKRWTTTGYILFFVCAMDRHHQLRGGAGVNKAVELIENASDGNLLTNRTQILEAWRDFKSVAHLATAVLAMQSKIPFQPSQIIIQSPSVFLGVAKYFQDFGVSFRARGQKDPLLAPNASWTIPEWLNLASLPNFDVRALNETELAVLKKYKAPTRFQ